MWHEDDLRSALRMLERETPAAETVLLHVTRRASAGQAGRERRRLPGRRLIAAAAAAAAVIVVAAISLLATQPGGHSTAPASSALQSVPRYYLALVPASTKSNAPQYGIIRDTVTGKTLATIRPPKPFVTFRAVTGAADDRTFVLTAQTSVIGTQDTPAKFYSVHFNPADGALTISPLTIPDIPGLDLAADALSPDGTRLAVAMSAGAFAQVRIYSLASGAVRVWQVGGADVLSLGADIAVELSWARSGILAFDWNGTYRAIPRHNRYRIVQESAPGTWLLNTAATSRGLLTDSRLAVCTPETTSVTFGYSGYLTPDGTKIIVPVTEPVKPGQHLRACVGSQESEPSSLTPPKLEEFSATTGKAISVIYTSDSRSSVPNYDVFWSNASGSVLVLDGPAGPGRAGPAKPGPRSKSVFGVLRGTTFTPIPGAPDAYTSMLAF